jgi:hypothetical protein
VLPIAFVKPSGKAISDMPISQAPAIGVALAPPQILPVGEVEAEAEIRVRFDEPMVAVAAVGKNAPAIATISPAIEGTWRWVDTRVAQFTAKASRLPQATEFKVSVAAGLRSISGATLAEAQTGTFVTPPVMIRGVYPHGTMRPDSPLLVETDQRSIRGDREALARRGREQEALAFTTLSFPEAEAAVGEESIGGSMRRTSARTT